MVLKCLTLLFKHILALHNIINFSSCRNYWGSAKQCVCPAPSIFHSGAASPPPPRIDASDFHELFTLTSIEVRWTPPLGLLVVLMQ